MSGSSCVLSNYPLSAGYRQQLEAQVGGEVTYLCMGDLRRLTPRAMLSKLRSVNTEKLILGLEEESGIPHLPLLEILASFTRAQHTFIAMPDSSVRTASRFSGLRAVAASVMASMACAVCVVRDYLRSKALLKKDRQSIVPQIGENRVLYLNANLWFGVKAGGSVGHIAGVANGLIDSGYKLDFASASGRQMVSQDARLVPLRPPSSFGLPYEGNRYRFGRDVVRQLSGPLGQNRYSFLYQRMSLANYSGVELARRHRLPLVLEYNCSEAWVADHWGDPLKFPRVAYEVEDACLRHAHVVVTVSDVLREELLGRGVEAERIVMYPNCVNPEMFDPAVHQEAGKKIRKQYGLGDDSLLAGFIGTFGKWHGADVLAESIRAMVASQSEFLLRHKIHFLMVGDGAMLPNVREILKDCEWQRFCTFTGLVPQDQAPEYLAATDIVLSPHVQNSDGSRFFGSPTKLFEYMVMGKAIVASDLDQIGKVLERSLKVEELPAGEPSGNEPRLAILVKPGSSDSLTQAIRFFAEHPRWREVLGQNVRGEALAKYTWANHVAAITARLKELRLIRP